MLAISIHAPAGGATYHRSSDEKYDHYFNSRPCGRGDTVPVPLGLRTFLFQFTPLREGRRLARLLWRKAARNFNSRPCGRGDLSFVAPMSIPVTFQFTPLREGRLVPLPVRPHALRISIHAPAGGATQCPRWNSTSDIYFNSRPCGRGDLVFLGLPQGYKNFNSRPCGRGDSVTTVE